jgi:hypothetical protein
MIAVFVFAWMIANSARTAELRVSSWAGFWAGLLSFVIYVVSQLAQIREPNLRYAVYTPGFMMPPLCGGTQKTLLQRSFAGTVASMCLAIQESLEGPHRGMHDLVCWLFPRESRTGL